MGESEKLVANLFEMARESAPAIIFIDEVDSLCGKRGDGDSDASRRIITQFLVQMQGVGKGGEQVLVLGATNTPWDLDTAIRRRFEKRIYIPLPDVEGRHKLLELHLGDTPNKLTHDHLRSFAERTEGLSGSDISVLVRQALLEPLRRLRRAKTFRRVNKAGPDGAMRSYWEPCSPGAPDAVEMNLKQVKPTELLEPDVLVEDFEAALDRCRTSVTAEDISKHNNWTQLYGEEG